VEHGLGSKKKKKKKKKKTDLDGSRHQDKGQPVGYSSWVGFNQSI